MAISHLCMSCGVDLTRVRAAPDPHYGLPVVVCPECETAVVRRVHPIWRTWRSFLRLGTTLVAIALQLAAAISCVTVTTVVCSELGNKLASGSILPHDEGDLTRVVMGLVVLPVVIGAWLAGGLHHWRRSVAWAAFAVLIAFLVAIDPIIVPLAEVVMEEAGAFNAEWPLEVTRWFARLQILAVWMIVATAGIPVGRVAVVFTDHIRRAIVRAQRRRRRLRRAAG